MADLSLRYYISICKDNAALLESIKTLLLEDFKSMENNFFAAAEKNDVRVMLNELHKMYPVASNLNFSQMMELIDKYRSSDPGEFKKFHDELKMCLGKIYELITHG